MDGRLYPGFPRQGGVYRLYREGVKSTVPVKIRLKRIGAKKRPFYRIVVANSTSARDGRFIDTIGHYDPCVDPPAITLDAEKALRWLGHGAQPTDITRALLKKQGILDRLTAAKEAAQKARTHTTSSEE
jgi:small subunit ribosomal protein S16